MALSPLTFLRQQCRLRRNVLTGEILYASDDSEEWQLLSQEGRNTILLSAQDKGIALTKEILDRFVDSTLIEEWNPAKEWLDSLPAWDGEDHVAKLSQRIVTSNPDWTERFHKWMQQTVARWMDLEVPQRDIIFQIITLKK